MSRANVDLVRGMYEAWIRHGRAVFGHPSAYEVIDAEMELRPDPAADWVGVDETYRGPVGVATYMAAVYEAFEDYHPEVEEFLDVGNKVVTLAIEHGRGRGSGAEVQAARTAHVWTIQDGRAIRLDLYLDRERTLEAVGLSE